MRSQYDARTNPVFTAEELDSCEDLAKLLNDAILEEKGETAVQRVECTVELSFDAYLPEKYIHSASQRIDAYKKIASIENDEDYRDVADELIDRYGDLPKSGLNLMKISLLRGMGSTAGIEKITQQESSVLLFPLKLDPDLWAAVAGELRGRLLLNAGAKPYISCRIKKEDQPLDFLADVLRRYLRQREARDAAAAGKEEEKK